jgi:hypothetical protein
MWDTEKSFGFGKFYFPIPFSRVFHSLGENQSLLGTSLASRCLIKTVEKYNYFRIPG